MIMPAARERKHGGYDPSYPQKPCSPASYSADKLEELPAELSQEETGGPEHPVEYLAPIEDSDNEHESSPKRQRKEKVVAMLTEEEEQTMVEWLVSNPILYNRKLKTYKDTNKKETLWREKAEEMSIDILILKTWYTSLRTRYGRLKKLCSRQDPPELTERDSWILGCFEFLRPHIFEVPKRTMMKKKVSGNPISPTEDGPGHDADTDHVDADPPAACPESVKPCSETSMIGTSSTRPATASTTCGRGAGADEEESLLTSLYERSQQFLALQQQLLDQLRPEGDRERDAFAEWLRSATRNLEHSVWRRCQRELIDVMYRYMAENDALRSKDPSQQAHDHG